MGLISDMEALVPAPGVFAYGTDWDLNIVEEVTDFVYMVTFPLRGVINYGDGYTSYEVILTIGKFSKYELGTKDHLPTIEEAKVKATEYLDLLWPGVSSITNIRSTDVKNLYDANLSGVRLAFNVIYPNPCP